MKKFATEGRIIVKVLKEENQTETGLYLAQSENPDLHKGTVVSVGLQKKDVKQMFTVDQVVYWQNYSGCTFTEGEDEYVILNQSDVLAIDILDEEVNCKEDHENE